MTENLNALSDKPTGYRPKESPAWAQRTNDIVAALKRGESEKSLRREHGRVAVDEALGKWASQILQEGRR